MPERMRGTPSVEDPFLLRICKALDWPPRMLAQRLGVPYEDIEVMLRPRHELVEIDRDELWWQVKQVVDERIGLLMAARQQLDVALQRDRSRRAVRIAEQRAADRNRRYPKRIDP